MKLLDVGRKYLTHRVVTGKVCGKKELIETIQKVPVKQLIGIISQISAFPERHDDADIRNGFISFLREQIPIIEADEYKLDEYLVYTHQGLLTLCKWFFAFGDFEKEEDAISLGWGITRALFLGIMVADYMGQTPGSLYPTITLPQNIIDNYRHKKLPYEIARNIMFNRQDNLGVELARIHFICYNMALNKSLYDNKEYVDFNEDHNKYYGYSIIEYIAVILILFAISDNEKRTIQIDKKLRLGELLGETCLGDKGKKIVNSLLMNFTETKKWAETSLDKPYEFTHFAAKPIALLNDQETLIPIIPNLFLKNLFTRIKINIEKGYGSNEKSKSKFDTFWGKVFEKYIEYLAIQSCKNKTEYILYPEINYSGKKSPDVIIKWRHKILAVEAKAKYLKKSSLFLDKDEELDKDKKRLILEPLEQVHDRIKELLVANTNIDLSGVTEIYLMSVTMGEFPVVPQFERDIRNRMKKYFKIPIKGYFHFGIAEFETLCGFMELGEYDIFALLQQYYDEMGEEFCFNDFLYYKGYKSIKPQFVNENFRESTQSIKKACGID